MKIKFFAFLAAILLVFGAFSFLDSNDGDIVLTERVIFKLKNTLDVQVQGKSEGKVSESLIQLSRTFTWTDSSGQTAASARTAIVSWGTEINVYDGKGTKIGSIEERIFSSWFRTWSTYDIKDARGNQLAVSEKSEWLGTTITLTSPSGAVIAKLDRPWINIWSDTWNVYIKKPGIVDNGILVMIAAFKTASDRDHASDSPSDQAPKKK